MYGSPDMKEWFNTGTIYIYNIYSMGMYIGLKIDSCTLGPRSSRWQFHLPQLSGTINPGSHSP